MAAVAPTRFEEALRRGMAAGGSSAVSWPAVFAGATAAAALSLILLVLGTGLGLAVVSPWSHGASAQAISWSTIGWIAFSALASSGLGGYIAGRLRVKWPSLHTDEVYFRDTAHGFLAWAVATLLTAAALTSVIGTVLGAGTTVGAGVAAGAVQAAGQAAGQGARLTGAQAPAQDGSQSMYAVDSLFRPAPGAAAGATPDDAGFAGRRSEIARIFDTGLRDGALSPDDTRYIGQVVAQRTGLSEQDAEARVTAVYGGAQKKLQDAELKAREAADKARKAGAYTALWVFVSLLLGAFFASLMATHGGRRRDMF